MFEILQNVQVKHIKKCVPECLILTGESKYDINVPTAGVIPTTRQILQVKIITPAHHASTKNAYLARLTESSLCKSAHLTERTCTLQWLLSAK